jgi:hypothetical protein
LESVSYLGTNAAGSELYDVDFMSQHQTAIIAPPAADGKIHGFLMLAGQPSQIPRGALVEVTAPADVLLYTRPHPAS